MSERVDPPASRRLSATMTYLGSKRRIVVTLEHGDRIRFSLESCDVEVGALDLVPLFWQAIRSNPGREKHPLQPHTGKGSAPKKRGPKPDKYYARQYGVSSNVIATWRRGGAPLADPDAMGDFIFTIKTRRAGHSRKVVARVSNRVKSELSGLDGHERATRVDLGLALLSSVAVPGVRYNYDEIAEWCGCTASMIWLIEQQALKKLRNRFQFMRDAKLRDLAIEFFDRRQSVQRSEALSCWAGCRR